MLAACKSNPQSEIATTFADTPSTSVSSSATIPPTLPEQAMSVTDMPFGWTRTTDATAVSLGQIGCLATASARAATKQSIYETFAGAGGAPIFSESLARFSAATTAPTYAAAVKALDTCKPISIKAGTVTLVGRLSPTSAPTVGLASRTYTLLATSGAHLLTEYVLVARSANAVMLTSYAAVKNPSITDFLSLSTKAGTKLS